MAPLAEVSDIRYMGFARIQNVKKLCGIIKMKSKRITKTLLPK